MVAKDTTEIIHKTREDYNRIAQYFSDTRRHPWTELEWLKKFIKNGQNILDWGCGNGRLIFLLSKKSGRASTDGARHDFVKSNYFGTDQSNGLLKIARKNFKKEIKEGWVNFFSTAVKKKKFPENFFDLVFMVASFHHLPDKQSRLELLADVYKQLKPKGKLIITVWNLQSDWAKAKADKTWKKIRENDYLIPWKNPEGEMLVERYYHHFSKEELSGLLKEAGFKIKSAGYGEKVSWTDKKGGRNLIVVAGK